MLDRVAIQFLHHEQCERVRNPGADFFRVMPFFLYILYDCSGLFCPFLYSSRTDQLIVASPAPVPVGWECRVHRLHLCKGVRLPNECPGYNTKQSDGEASVIRELWEMRSTALLPGTLWTGLVAPDRVPSMSHIEQNSVKKKLLN